MAKNSAATKTNEDKNETILWQKGEESREKLDKQKGFLRASLYMQEIKDTASGEGRGVGGGGG